MISYIKRTCFKISFNCPHHSIFAITLPCRNVFARISPLSKLSLLREGLKIFLKHFLLSKNTTKLEGKVIAPGRLKELVEIAEAALDGREVVKF